MVVFGRIRDLVLRGAPDSSRPLRARFKAGRPAGGLEWVGTALLNVVVLYLVGALH